MKAGLRRVFLNEDTQTESFHYGLFLRQRVTENLKHCSQTAKPDESFCSALC